MRRLAFVLVPAALLAGGPTSPVAARTAVSPFGAPAVVSPVVARDVAGRVWQLLAPAAGRFDVLFFISNECPISNRYAPEINRICTEYAPRGVTCYLVYPDRTTSIADVEKHRRDYGLSAPATAFLDATGEIVKAVAPDVTPEAALYGHGGRLYRGRIDDLYVDIGRTRPAPTRHDLRLALDAALAGRPVVPAETRAVGCTIDGPTAPSSGALPPATAPALFTAPTGRVLERELSDARRPSSPSPLLDARAGGLLVPAHATPTFSKDIAPIVYNHCTVCHRPGQSAPFPLVSYDDVVKHGAFIAKVTSRRVMPPWHATAADGFPSFRDDRRLTDDEIATIGAWVDAGMPAGDLKKAPAPPKFPTGWVLGPPDVILTMPRAVDVPADGPDLYRNVVLHIDLPEDRWITAVDFEPTARTVVHHALFFAGPSSLSAGVRDDELLPGLNTGLIAGLGRLGRAVGAGARAGAQVGAADDAWGGLGGYVPGMMPRFFPDGIAQLLPAHSDFIIQLHLHPDGKSEREDGQLGVYFAKSPPAKSLTGIQVPPMFGYAAGIDIPAGESHYTMHDSFELPVAVEAIGARGHAHYLAKSMKMTATLPDGTTKGLLWISDWDFGWQDSYFYTTPFTLPKGTRIDTEIVYDNSDANVRNPNTPPKRVKWGRESFDEMGSMTLLVAAPSAADNTTLRQAEAAHFRQQLLTMLRAGRRLER